MKTEIYNDNLGQWLFKKIACYQLFIWVTTLFTCFFLTAKIHSFHIIAILILPTYIFIAKLFYQHTVNFKYKNYVFSLIFWSFIFRIIAIFTIAGILIYLQDIPFLTLKDDYVYNETANLIAVHWKEHGLFSQGHNIPFSVGFYAGYPNISAFFIYLFGEGWVAPRIGNAIFSSITALFFYKISLFVYSEKDSRIISSLFAFSPIFIIFSSLQLKDTALLLFLVMALYYIILMFQKKHILRSVVLLASLLTTLLFFRAVLVVVLFFSLMLYYLFSYLLKYPISDRKKILSIFGILITFSLFLIFWDTLALTDLIIAPDIFWDERFVAILNDTDRLLTDNSVLSSSNLKNLFSAPLFMIGSIFTPIPLSVYIPLPDSAFTNYSFIPNIVLSSLKPIFIIAIINTIKLRKYQNTLLFFLIFYVVYKLGQATSMSILDIRRTLPAVLIVYFLLPMAFSTPSKKYISKIALIISIISVFLFSFVRLYIRGAL